MSMIEVLKILTQITILIYQWQLVQEIDYVYVGKMPYLGFLG